MVGRRSIKGFAPAPLNSGGPLPILAGERQRSLRLMPTYKSTRFGRFEIADDAILEFPAGVAGLTHLNWFTVLKRRSDSVFLWLQSLEESAIALPIVLPWAFHWEYEIELVDGDMRTLGVSAADQVSIYCLVDINDEMRSATVDLSSPIVINHERRIARQLIKIAAGYSSCEPLFGGESAITPVSMREEDTSTVTILDRAA